MTRTPAGEALPPGSPPRRIVVFARAPLLGTVKTRLAADIGEVAALDVYRRLGAHAVSAALAVPDAGVVVQFTPADGAPSIRDWLRPLGGELALRAQATGDLGHRMAGAIAEALDEGDGAVVVIGTDCPTMDARVIALAFERLADADVVIGPALDGGYYLIGTRALHPSLFHGIPWSSSDTLERTLVAAHAAGLRVALLDPRADVDSGADWRRWKADGSGAGPPVSGSPTS